MGYMHYFALLFTKSQCFAGVRLWLRNPITLFTLLPRRGLLGNREPIFFVGVSRRLFIRCATGAKGRISPVRSFCLMAPARRSGALTLVPLTDQLLDRARQSRLEVDQLRPRRGHDDPDHAVGERTHLRLPVGPLLGRHLVGAARLEVLIRDAIDDVQLGPTADEQDLGW